MASTLQNVAISEMTFIPAFAADLRKSVYEENRQRIYALAFWMTNSELEAEQLLENTFVRVFRADETPTEEQIDAAFLAEVRRDYNVGTLSLACETAAEVLNVRGNTKRVHLELAVVQLPATEKLIFLMHDVEGYSHGRIARTLGISSNDSKLGLHAARLRVRELVSKMAW